METQETLAALYPMNHKHKWISTKPVYTGERDTIKSSLKYPITAYIFKKPFFYLRKHLVMFSIAIPGINDI